eukprot:768571-Hanusia_phi.AAC.6
MGKGLKVGCGVWGSREGYKETGGGSRKQGVVKWNGAGKRRGGCLISFAASPLTASRPEAPLPSPHPSCSPSILRRTSGLKSLHGSCFGTADLNNPPPSYTYHSSSSLLTRSIPLLCPHRQSKLFPSGGAIKTIPKKQEFGLILRSD